MTHTLGTPELAILAPLRPGSAGHILNAIGERIRSGEPIEGGARLAGVLADRRAVILGVVDESWHRPLFGYASWFYQRPPLRFLQVVLGDANNRFPDDPEADEGIRQHQPSLAVPVGSHPLCDWTGEVLAERWRFPAWPSKMVYVSRSVTSGASSVLHVIHDAEDDWAFADGLNDFRPEKMGLEQLMRVVERDSRVEELGDLGRGWEARRPDSRAPWTRHPVA